MLRALWSSLFPGQSKTSLRRSWRLLLDQLEDRTLPAAWTALGPAPILNGQIPGTGPVSGRLTALAADPTGNLYVGASGGGVWKEAAGGTTWTALTDNQSTLSMGAIAIAPSNSSIIYAGTGEANNSGDCFYGRGVLKSTDAGATWTLVGNSVFDRTTIAKIVVDPANPNIVYVAGGNPGENSLTNTNLEPYTAAKAGVWKSIDGGTTWTDTTNNGSFSLPNINYSYDNFCDLVMDPSNSQTLYTGVFSYREFASDFSTGGGIYKSTNGGATWALLTGGLPSGKTVGRVALAVAPTASQTLYASIAGTGQTGSTAAGSLFKMMKSTNGGTTWTQLTNTPDYFGTNHQGLYDTTLVVDPSNANVVYAGGCVATNNISFILKTADGGSTWTNIGLGADGNGPHADNHAIGFDNTGKLLVGTDGGIWRLDNATVGSLHWSDLNTNLNTVEFVGIALHPTNGNIAYGGSQDNGMEAYSGSLGWNRIRAGDGGFVRVDQTTPTTIYHTYPFGAGFLERSDNSGTTWAAKTTGISTNDPANFYVPYVMDPANSSRLLLGTNRVYETTNRGDRWSPLSTVGRNGWTINYVIDSLAAAKTNASVIYASAGGSVMVTQNHGKTWTLTKPVPTPPVAIYAIQLDDLVVDPTTAGTAYVTAAGFSDVTGGGHVWKTTNYGASWTNISSGLPDLPVWCIELDPKGAGSADDVLYVGTDNGVWSSTGGGAWTRFGTGLPNVQVTDLELKPNLGILAAGTYGRGMWEISSVGGAVAAPAAADLAGFTAIFGATASDSDATEQQAWRGFQGKLEASSAILPSAGGQGSANAPLWVVEARRAFLDDGGTEAEWHAVLKLFDSDLGWEW